MFQVVRCDLREAPVDHAGALNGGPEPTHPTLRSRQMSVTFAEDELLPGLPLALASQHLREEGGVGTLRASCDFGVPTMIFPSTLTAFSCT